MFIIGLIMVIPSAIAHIPFYRKGEEFMGVISVVILTVQLIGLIASIIPTEIALKKQFPENETNVLSKK